MSVSKRKGNEFYHFNFKRGGIRYQGSTGERERRAALKFEDLYKKEVEEQIRRGTLLSVPAQSPLPLTRHVPTVGELEKLVASKHRESRRDSEFFRNLTYLSQTIGVDRLIDEIGETEITRLILSEKIKGLLVGRRRRNFPGPIEPLLPDEFVLRGPVASEEELVDILDILTERGAESDSPRKLLGASSMIKSFARPINAMRWKAREMGTTLPVLKNLRDKVFGRYGRNRVLSATEEFILRASCDPARMTVYDFALQSLLRLSNVIGLCWRDVDLLNRRISVRIKGGHSFYRFISDEMIRLLVDQWNMPDRHDEFVFTRVSARSGKRVPISDKISELFTQDCAKAGITDIVFHDLRRTGATRMYDADHDIDTVKDALGHRNVATTWLYIVSRPGNSERTELKRAARDRAAAAAARAMMSGEFGRLPSEGEILLAIDTKAELEASSIHAIVAAISAVRAGIRAADASMLGGHYRRVESADRMVISRKGRLYTRQLVEGQPVDFAGAQKAFSERPVLGLGEAEMSPFRFTEMATYPLSRQHWLRPRTGPLSALSLGSHAVHEGWGRALLIACDQFAKELEAAGTLTRAFAIVDDVMYIECVEPVWTLSHVTILGRAHWPYLAQLLARWKAERPDADLFSLPSATRTT